MFMSKYKNLSPRSSHKNKMREKRMRDLEKKLKSNIKKRKIKQEEYNNG